MRDGTGSTSKRGAESKLRLSRTKSHIAPDVIATTFEFIQQGQWANLPEELLFDIIQRVEESETSWPARAVVVFCASVCKSWRSITKEIVKTPEQCGRITFPISLKQVINSSPFFCPTLLCFLRSFPFMCMDSPVHVILQYSALSGGAKKVLHICCTLAWFHVSYFIAETFHVAECTLLDIKSSLYV